MVFKWLSCVSVLKNLQKIHLFFSTKKVIKIVVALQIILEKLEKYKSIIMTTITSTMEVRLKRFLYTSREDPVYITGDACYHKAYLSDKVKVVEEILQSDNPKLLLNIVQIVNSENLIPRRDTIIFVLAIAATIATDNDFKHEIYTTVLNIVKSSKEIFTFLKYYSQQQRSFNSSLNKMIRSYYYRKDPMELAVEVTKSNGAHGWTHKDVLKLCHGKSNCIRTQTVVSYVLHGLAKAKSVAEENAVATPVITLFSNILELKRCENEKRVVELMRKLRCDNINQVPSFFHKSQLVWEALIPHISVSELIRILPRLHKCGFLKANSSFQSKVIELLKADVIKASGIYPLEVFIALKNFERGGKPMDPQQKLYLEGIAKTDSETSKEGEGAAAPKIEPTVQEPIKCPPIMTTLHKALHTSYQNITSTGRRIFIGIEVSKEMDTPCLTSKNVTCFDAATVLILSFLRSERDVTIAVFNGTKISIVSIEKHSSIAQAQAALRKAASGTAMLTPFFEWAVTKKKQVDVFITFLQGQSFASLPRQNRDKARALKVLDTYRKKMALPHTKLISFFLNSTRTTLADGSSNVLDICGIDKDVSNIFEAFSKGLFY